MSQPVRLSRDAANSTTFPHSQSPKRSLPVAAESSKRSRQTSTSAPRHPARPAAPHQDKSPAAPPECCIQQARPTQIHSRNASLAQTRATVQASQNKGYSSEPTPPSESCGSARPGSPAYLSAQSPLPEPPARLSA